MGVIQLYIQSEHQWLIDALVTKLDSLGDKLSVVTSSEPTWSYELSYPSRLVLNQPRLVNSIREALSPLRYPERVTSKLSRNTIYLRLGSPIPLKRHPLQLSAESARIQGVISADLSARLPVQTRHGAPLRSMLRYGGASLFVRDVIHLFCAQHGVELAEDRVWGDEELELYLSVLDPELRGPELRSTLEVSLLSDAPLSDQAMCAQLFVPLIQSLHQSGYHNVKHISDKEISETPLETPLISWESAETFSMILDGYHAPEEVRRLTSSVQRGLTALEVSAESHPVQVIHSSSLQASMTNSTRRVVVMCPLKRLREGALYPIGGDHPTRWAIKLRLDDLAWAGPLQSALARHGFTRVSVDEDALCEPHGGALTIRWASMINYTHRCSSLRAAILEVVEPPLWVDLPLSMPREGDFELERSRHVSAQAQASGSSESINVIEISLYTRDLDPLMWRERLNSLAEECTLTFTTHTRDHAVNELYRSFSVLPWSEISLETLGDLEELFEPQHLRDLLDDEAHLEELEELLTLSGELSMDEREGLSSRDGELDLDPSHHDHSSYEWLDMRLDALYQSGGEDHHYEHFKDEIYVRFGGASLTLIAWVRARLVLLTQTEVTLSHEFTDDDLEIWVELPPHIQLDELAHPDREVTPLDSITVERSTSPKLWLVNTTSNARASRRR